MRSGGRAPSKSKEHYQQPNIQARILRRPTEFGLLVSASEEVSATILSVIAGVWSAIRTFRLWTVDSLLPENGPVELA
jgi:hypothetical protein